MPDPTTLDTISRLISNLGFPIFVACYLLFKVTPALNGVVEQLAALTRAVTSVTDQHH